MTESGAIIGFAEWLETPAGCYLLAWEQQHLDEALVDVFGFHALQLGLSRLDALAANRMPHRWVATQEPAGPRVNAARPPLPASAVSAAGVSAAGTGTVPLALRCDFDALPFDSASLDLVVLPHTLELSRDAHQTLREVERVLRPEGRVVIVGFNPASLWGLRRRLGGLRPHRTAAADGGTAAFLPSAGDFLGYRRLRDWLRLLSFEVESGRFGCYRPPVVSEKWLARFGWVESVGDRWWPVFGALYALTAVKRVRGMRLVGLVRDQQRAPSAKAAPAVVVQQQRGRQRQERERETA